jgi:hypothetical protein
MDLWDCQSAYPSVRAWKQHMPHPDRMCLWVFPLQLKCPHVTRKAGGDLKQRLGVRLHSDGEQTKSLGDRKTLAACCSHFAVASSHKTKAI